MNDMSVKIEQLLKLQKGVCEQYEKENKELLKTIKAQEEQIRLSFLHPLLIDPFSLHFPDLPLAGFSVT